MDGNCLSNLGLLCCYRDARTPTKLKNTMFSEASNDPYISQKNGTKEPQTSQTNLYENSAKRLPYE
jgi:hypothetical protein